MVRKVKFGIKVCRVKLNIGRFLHFGNGFQLWVRGEGCENLPFFEKEIEIICFKCKFN
jgi:hypothetical protein